MNSHLKLPIQIVFFALVILSITLGGCAGELSEQGTPTKEIQAEDIGGVMQIPTFPPGDFPNVVPLDHSIFDSFQVEELETIINEATVVVDQPEIREVDGDTFTFTATEETLSLKPDDVIVGEPTDNAPEGFLRKVVNIRQEDDVVIVETKQASLVEAFKQGTFRFRKTLTTEDVVAQRSGGGMLLKSKPPSLQNPKITIPLLDEVLAENDEGGQIKANGSIDVEPFIDLAIVIEGAQVKQISFFSAITRTTSLSLDATMDLAEFESSPVELNPITFEPIVFWYSGIPITIKPELVISIGIKGSVSTGIKTSLEQDTIYRTLAHYSSSNNRWDKVWARDISQPVFTPPDLSLNANTTVFAKPEFALKLYGIVGAYANLGTYLKLDVTPLSQPILVLAGEMQANIGVKIEIFDLKLAELSWEFAPYRKEFFRYETTQDVEPSQLEPVTPTETPSKSPTPPKPTGTPSKSPTPPKPTETPLPPTDTPTPTSSISDSPVQAVIDYWYYVSTGQFEISWNMLSSDFQERMHDGEFSHYHDFYRGRFCRIDTNDVHLLQQGDNHATISAEVTYIFGADCSTIREYDFEIHLVYDLDRNTWFYDATYERPNEITHLAQVHVSSKISVPN
jgi:hypothetical protein